MNRHLAKAILEGFAGICLLILAVRAGSEGLHLAAWQRVLVSLVGSATLVLAALALAAYSAERQSASLRAREAERLRRMREELNRTPHRAVG